MKKGIQNGEHSMAFYYMWAVGHTQVLQMPHRKPVNEGTSVKDTQEEGERLSLDIFGDSKFFVFCIWTTYSKLKMNFKK